MFAVAELEDDVRIPPSELGKPTLAALTTEIQNALLDKVIREVGLAISLFDISSVEGAFVLPSDPAPHFQVTFRLVVFSPFVGEAIVGRIASSDETGLHVSLGFFSDIFIPSHHLQEPSIFNEEEGVWIWKFNDNDMFMDIDEQIRFRVTQVSYPPLPVEQPKGAKPFAPMQIVGDINGDGLGLVSWWQ